MKFFTSSIERLENKIERLSNENTLLKQEVESLKIGADVQNKWFEERKRDLEEIRARDPIEEDIKLIEQKHQQLEEKISELEYRSRWNNLRFSGFTRRTGSKLNGKKRLIIVKFLNYKDKDVVLNQYRQKPLWKDNIYINEDYSERTAEL